MKEREENCCRKGHPFQGPKGGSGLTLRNELSEETNMLTKQKTSLGRSAQAESRRVRKPTWLKVSGFMVMGLGCLWSIILTQGPSWSYTQCSGKIDANEKDSER